MALSIYFTAETVLTATILNLGITAAKTISGMMIDYSVIIFGL